MKTNCIMRSLFLLLLASALLQLTSAKQIAQHERVLAPLELAADGDSVDISPHGNDEEAASFFETLWAPIRTTLKRARQLFGSGVGVAQGQIDELRERAFKVFMRAYNKTYSPEELPKRMALYLKRMQVIEQSIKMFQDGKQTFMMKPNRFLDWDEREINMLSRASLPDELEPEELESNETTSLSRQVRDVDDYEDDYYQDDEEEYLDDDDDDPGFVVRAETVPAQFSWRQSGCDATPIDQGICGSCYAVATMSVVETTRCIKQGSGATLSKQQIVDCGLNRGYNIHGCDGGWPTSVFKYLQNTRSVARESCYPYRLANSQRASSCSLRNKLSGQSNCSVNPALQANRQVQYKVLHNENDILYHVAKTGPVVTVIQTTDKLLYYGAGIMEDPGKCRGGRNDVDHAISIVGYGTENGIPYWEIKNSWGTEWGDGGYAKVRRGRNTCSIGRWGWVMTG